MRLLSTSLLSLCLFLGVQAQNSVKLNGNKFTQDPSIDYRLGTVDQPVMHAVRISGDEITLDGFLDDPAWLLAPVATGFTQRYPKDGGSPTQRTEARILYTDKEIYVGIMAYDTAPDSVIASLFRRDGNETSDWVYVSFDSYNDKRTAFTFGVNPRGVQKDILSFDDNNQDLLWDAVWDAEAKILDNGWSVEMRIPLSQLRFSSKDQTQTWRVNFQRSIARTNESNFWSPTAQSESGIVSKFGRLEGISDLSKPRRLEVTPYVSSKLTRAPERVGDPYYSANEIAGNVGGDIKYGLTSDLTLTATINPDFGQVEADPATINLSQYEIFFPEQRPFFLEGNDIFRFGRTQTYNTFGNPNTFYSRRIGRSPQGNVFLANEYNNGSLFNPDSAQGQSMYVDRPEQTSILGAAKVSGKTKAGTSIGVLYARTVEERARYTVGQQSLNDRSGNFMVEPESNYFVSRVKQDVNGGNTIFGGFFSGVNRDIDGTYFETYLHESAVIGGVDFEHSWRNRDYTFSGTLSATNVAGTPEAILRTQRAPQRYYQRVDSDKLSIDSTRSSLGGIATELSFKKGGGEHFTGSITFSQVTPGYETNDIGFQNRADYRALALAFRYRETSPKTFEYWELWSNHLHVWNFDGDRLFQNYNLGGFWRFRNQWSFHVNVNGSLGRVSDRLTRGGPLMKYNDDINFNFNVNSNRAKKLSFYTGQFHRVDVSNEYDHYFWAGFDYRPTTFIQISVDPEFGFQMDEDQFVRSVADPAATQTYGTRYVFADIRSINFSTGIRLNWTFNPKMSLQTYMRPYIATGEYSRFKEFTKPGGFEFAVYGEDRGSISFDGSVYTVDPDGGDNSNEFILPKQDFNFKSIQGNAVFRWEYRPGSTLFLVWQQHRSGVAGYGDFEFGRDFQDLFGPKPTNVFLVKLSYWFSS